MERLGHQTKVGERSSTNDGVNMNQTTQTSGNCNNPMLNSVVLERLCALCDLGDLKRFRLVCNLWNKVSLSRWRSQMTVTIQSNKYDLEHEKMLSWTKIHEIVPPLEAMPFRAYRLEGLDFRTSLSHPYNASSLETFFISYGSWMRELTLTCPAIAHANVLKRVIFELTPNLKMLVLDAMKSERLLHSLKRYLGDGEEEEDSDDTADEVAEVGEVANDTLQCNLTILKVSLVSLIARNSEWFPVSWLEYFRHFPNIESLELGKLGEQHIGKFVEVLQANKEYGRKIKKIDLQNLKLYVTDIRRILSLPQLQLEELHVQIRLEEHLDSSDEDDPGSLYHYGKLGKNYPELIYPSPPDPELHSFIQEQAHILHTLHLRTNDLYDHKVRYIDFRFQTSLESLTKLVLRGNITDNWNFLQYTPNLKVLHIYKFNLKNMFEKNSYKQVEEEEISVLLDCMEELRFKSMEGKEDKPPLFQIPPYTLKFLAKCMPNLKVLEAPLTNESFHVVCSSWTGLRELYASNSGKLDDEGITGMVPGCETHLHFPNITYLKSLEVFSTRSTLLTNASVLHGFLQLPMLQTVNVFRSSKISQTIRYSMERSFSSRRKGY